MNWRGFYGTIFFYLFIYLSIYWVQVFYIPPLFLVACTKSSCSAHLVYQQLIWFRLSLTQSWHLLSMHLLMKNATCKTDLRAFGRSPTLSPRISLAADQQPPLIRKWERLFLGLGVSTARDASPRKSRNIWGIMNPTSVNKKWNTTTRSLGFFFFSILFDWWIIDDLSLRELSPDRADVNLQWKPCQLRIGSLLSLQFMQNVIGYDKARARARPHVCDTTSRNIPHSRSMYECMFTLDIVVVTVQSVRGKTNVSVVSRLNSQNASQLAFNQSHCTGASLFIALCKAQMTVRYEALTKEYSK